jgi:hypothetical protein
MERNQHHARAFFGRRKGHKLRKRQAELIDTLLPRLAIDLDNPAPPDPAVLFPIAVSDVRLEIGFGRRRRGRRRDLSASSPSSTGWQRRSRQSKAPTCRTSACISTTRRA